MLNSRIKHGITSQKYKEIGRIQLHISTRFNLLRGHSQKDLR